MRLKTGLLLFLLLLTITGDTLGRRTSGGFGGGRSSTSLSGGWFGKATSGRSSSSSNHGSSSTHSRVPPPTSFGNHGTSSSSGSHPTATHKDITTSFLNAEGGGATRPNRPHENPFGNTKPSAPPAHPFGIHTPSAPPAEHVPKASVPLQTQGNAPYNPTLGQTNPPWSNPYMATGHFPLVSHTSRTGSRNGYANHSISHGVSAPPVGRVPPYPTTHVGTPSQPAPQPPGIGFKPSYLNGSTMHSVSAPPLGRVPPYPTTHVGSSIPNVNQPMGGQSFPHMYPSAPNYPGFHHPSHVPMGSPYSTHSVSSASGVYGQPHVIQQPQMLAQPAAQPFVPGQTVIMMPGQQDSGRGVGQILKEALIFSSVNIGMNKLINGLSSSHHTTESRPVDSANGGGTTHITYNNYYNNSPGTEGNSQPGAVPGGNLPQGSVSPGVPAGYPSTWPSPNVGMSGTAPLPGSTNNINVPSGVNAGTLNGGSTSILGAATTGGVVANTNPQNTNSQGNAANNVPVGTLPQYKISDAELYNITEQLFAKQSFNVSKYITLNLQNRSTSSNLTDQAKEPLFFVQPELLEYPTISVTRALFNNYEHESHKKENRTIEKRKDENLLIDTFLNTNIMTSAMQWLADKGFIYPDDFERKDILRHIWFTHFGGTTCGFERVFMSEKYGDVALLGVQSWLYFDNQEYLKRINYMSYSDKLNLGNSSSLLKLNFEMDGIIRQNATIFVGTLPELEMSLYTVCFYARPNDLCPVSLGGSKFNIFTHSFRYFGTDLIDLAVIIF